jgi:hypothetical protein
MLTAINSAKNNYLFNDKMNMQHTGIFIGIPLGNFRRAARPAAFYPRPAAFYFRPAAVYRRPSALSPKMTALLALNLIHNLYSTTNNVFVYKGSLLI